jgi:hypothetical protein
MTPIVGLPSGVQPATAVTPVMTTAELTRLAAALRNRAAGALLNGLVVGQDRTGATLLRLDNGNVVGLRLPGAVAVGTTVTIELQTNAGQTQAVLLSAKPPAELPAGAPRTPAAPQQPFQVRIDLPATGSAPLAGEPAAGAQAKFTPVATSTAPALPPSSTVASSPPLVATVIARLTEAEQAHGIAQSPEAAQLVPGTQIKLRVVQLPARPAMAPLPASGPATPATAALPLEMDALTPREPLAPISRPGMAPSTVAAAPAQGVPVPPAPGAAPRAPAPSAGTAVPGSSAPIVTATPSAITAQVSSAGEELPLDLPLAAAHAPGPLQVPAVIIGRTPAAQTVIDTSLGRLALALPPGIGAVKIGDRLMFALAAELPHPAPTVAAPAQPGPYAAVPARPQDLPALHAIFVHLTRSAPAEQREPFVRNLPQPGSRLAAQLLSFFAAAAQHSAEQIVGDRTAANLAAAGRSDLLEALGQELQDVARTAPRAGEWQMYPVPLLHPDGLATLRFYGRRRKEAAARSGRDERRFIVECDLSALGTIQVDGLMQKPEGTMPHLDLVVRSHADLPAEMRRDLQSLFLTACEDCRLTGKIAFQASAKFALADTAPHASAAIVV